MKKFLALLLAVVMVVSMAALAGCANTAPEDDAKDSTSGTAQQSGETTQDSSKKVKIGFIFLHDENSTYDKNFLDAAQAACEATGAEIILKKMCQKQVLAMKLLAIWQMQAALLFLQILSDMNLSCYRLLRNIRRFSSVMLPVRWHTPKSSTISTMRLLPFMRVDIWRVLPQV